MGRTCEFHRLEEHDYDKVRSNLSVTCSFETDRFGYVQVRLTRMGKRYPKGETIYTWKFKTLDQEPDLNMLTDEQHLYMEQICRIVWRMVYDTPAMKKRFE